MKIRSPPSLLNEDETKERQPIIQTRRLTRTIRSKKTPHEVHQRKTIATGHSTNVGGGGHRSRRGRAVTIDITFLFGRKKEPQLGHLATGLGQKNSRKASKKIKMINRRTASTSENGLKTKKRRGRTLLRKEIPELVHTHKKEDLTQQKKKGLKEDLARVHAVCKRLRGKTTGCEQAQRKGGKPGGRNDVNVPERRAQSSLYFG